MGYCWRIRHFGVTFGHGGTSIIGAGDRVDPAAEDQAVGYQPDGVAAGVGVGGCLPS